MNLLNRLRQKQQATEHNKPPIHGGRLQMAITNSRDISHASASEWLDLSTGINPHPWPVPDLPSSCWQRLPENAEQLKQSARHYYGGALHSSDHTELLAMPGSQWFIQTFPRLVAEVCSTKDSPLSVLIPDIGFSEHGYWWRNHAQQIEQYHEAAVTELLEADIQADVLVLINPNNPSSQQVPAQRIRDAATRNANTVFIIDEAFMDSRPENSLLNTGAPLPDNLILLRSMGKFFGLAGLRVGFCIADSSICRLLEKELGPWPMATASEQLAIQALNDTHWQAQARQQLQRLSALQFDMLKKEFKSGPRLYRNDFFITLDFHSPEAADRFHQALLQQAVLSRRIENSALVRLGLAREDDLAVLQQRLQAVLANNPAL